MTKKISITLTQDQDGNFRVKGFANTAQLTVGQVVPREKVALWTSDLPAMRHVRVNVTGPTPVDQDGANLLALHE